MFLNGIRTFVTSCAILTLLLCCVTSGDGGLVQLKGPLCGSLQCKAQEYCNQYSHSCDPCQDICNPEHHNYDEPKCKRECEVFIYDQRYLPRSDSGTDDGNLRAAVQKLQFNYIVTLTLLIIVILVLVAVFSLFIWRWKTNNNVTWATIHHKISKKGSDNNTNGVSAAKNATNDEQGGKKPGLRLEITSNSGQSEPTPVTMTTGITSRIPAEDSIDYAYDNPAMTNSPKSKMRVKKF